MPKASGIRKLFVAAASAVASSLIPAAGASPASADPVGIYSPAAMEFDDFMRKFTPAITLDQLVHIPTGRGSPFHFAFIDTRKRMMFVANGPTEGCEFILVHDVTEKDIAGIRRRMARLPGKYKMPTIRKGGKDVPIKAGTPLGHWLRPTGKADLQRNHELKLERGDPAVYALPGNLWRRMGKPNRLVVKRHGEVIGNIDLSKNEEFAKMYSRVFGNRSNDGPPPFLAKEVTDGTLLKSAWELARQKQRAGRAAEDHRRRAAELRNTLPPPIRYSPVDKLKKHKSHRRSLHHEPSPRAARGRTEPRTGHAEPAVPMPRAYPGRRPGALAR